MPIVEHRGAAAHYAEAGSGENIVLVHGSCGAGGQWTGVARSLHGQARVTLPDLYGYGATAGWPGRRALTLADEADLLHAMIARQGGPIHLVGHSYGGAVALRYALGRPENVATLTLIEPVAFNLLRFGSRGDKSSLEEIKCLAGGIWQSVARGEDWPAMARFVDYWNGAGTWTLLDDDQRQALAVKTRKVSQDFWAVLNDDVSLSDVASLAMPTAIVSGALSPLPAQRIARLFEAAARGATVKVVHDGGHMLPLTHAERIAGMIAAHVFAHPAQARMAA